MNKNELAKMIDQTLLKPEATRLEVEAFVREAAQYHFQSCCVNVSWIELVAKLLEGTDVLPCATVAFPFGTLPIETKRIEAETAIALGAKEIDYVINIGKAREEDYPYLEKEARAVVQVAHEKGVAVKAILELCYLTEEQKRIAAKAVSRGGVDFLKTSTGYGSGGATIEDVKLLRSIAGEKIGVKASGGLRDTETALRFIEAGASRIGASSGVKILMGLK